ncbi:hypothetical protein SARC_07159 [Sphaeroforma arctica JP610]|uniref:Rho-GAP domain-containing protein n=1 Tax=Sphaeroforma arctica JP610 TaxID=667725 RepID=A0A0L0FUH3_9EUKA|nr:hypothetical protein SARC_07159 [Sphaeroforma arctica JP610]KNC80482.1 hypothetical protein SARC_07159 [Sphaeroforma arctica JP610]|eukprot:XP_014154384.1 hypothetical protein SARC_07159 [Sphaeroforma arctica JP610]
MSLNGIASATFAARAAFPAKTCYQLYGPSESFSALLRKEITPDLYTPATTAPSKTAKYIGQNLAAQALTYVKQIKAAVPEFLYELGSQISRKEFLTTKGIFRLPGGLKQIQLLEKKIELPNADVKGLLSEVEDSRVLTGLLKVYIKNLPQPIINSSELNEFERALDNDETFMQLAMIMPDMHLNVLRYILRILRAIAARKKVNEMNAE